MTAALSPGTALAIQFRRLCETFGDDLFNADLPTAAAALYDSPADLRTVVALLGAPEALWEALAASDGPLREGAARLFTAAAMLLDGEARATSIAAAAATAMLGGTRSSARAAARLALRTAPKESVAALIAQTVADDDCEGLRLLLSFSW